jgi:hypothetical protein
MSKQVNVIGNPAAIWYDVVGDPMRSHLIPGKPWYVEFRHLDGSIHCCYVRDSDLRDTPPAIEVPSEVWVNVYASGSMYAYRDEAIAKPRISELPSVTTRYVLPLPWKKCEVGTVIRGARILVSSKRGVFLVVDIYEPTCNDQFYLADSDLLATLPKEEGK